MGRRGDHFRRSGESGFTLLELSAALFVLAVGLFGVIQFYYTGLERGRLIREETEARRALENEIETLRSLPFDELRPREHAPFVSNTPRVELLANPATKLRIEPVAGMESDLVEVTASIAWRNRQGRRVEKTLTTMIARKALGP